MKPSVSSLYQAAELAQDIRPLVIGERTNSNGSKLFRDLLLENDYEGCLAIALAQEAAIAAGGRGFHGFSLSHNVQSESEVDEVMELAKAAGATITRQPHKSDWGGYHGYFKDPDGYLWEIAHNPFFWVGPTD